MENFKNYIDKKDKSTLIGQLFSVVLLILLIILAFIFDPDKLLCGAILSAGVGTGWIIGILVSPFHEYNNETERFSKAQQLLSSFVTGAVAVKIFALLTPDNMAVLFYNSLLLSRLLYYTASAIFTGVIVYYDRVYLEDQVKAKLSLDRNGLKRREVVPIEIDGLNDLLEVCISNKGKTDLWVLRSDSFPQGQTPDLSIGREIKAGDKPKKMEVRELSPSGKYLFVVNGDKDDYASFGLRIV